MVEIIWPLEINVKFVVNDVFYQLIIMVGTSIRKENMHIFHNWDVIHSYTLPNGHGWFENRKCKTCSVEKMRSHLNFFSNFADAIQLGIEQGLYIGLHESDGWDKVFDELFKK